MARNMARATGPWILEFPPCNPRCVRRWEFENPQSNACGNNRRAAEYQNKKLVRVPTPQAASTVTVIVLNFRCKSKYSGVPGGTKGGPPESENQRKTQKNLQNLYFSLFFFNSYFFIIPIHKY